MSLINEALKKAQRARTAGTGGSLPPMPGGGPVAKRGQARSANTMVLLGSGAVVLVVLSVVATVYLLNRPAPRAPAAIVAPKPVVAAIAGESATVKPLIPAPPVAASSAAAPAAATTTSAPPLAAAAPAVVAPAPRSSASTPAAPAAAPAATPAPSSPPSAPAIPRPDERVAAYVEALRISGVRAMGAESRVLINERVYKVNDVVERTLGIRLIAVAPGSLTFADGNGLTYVKQI